MRTTDQEINEAVEEMKKSTGLPLDPYWAYGRVRLVIEGHPGRGRNAFSPMFNTNAELMNWIDAFMQGWQMRGLAPVKQ